MTCRQSALFSTARIGTLAGFAGTTPARTAPAATPVEAYQASNDITVTGQVASRPVPERRVDRFRREVPYAVAERAR